MDISESRTVANEKYNHQLISPSESRTNANNWLWVRSDWGRGHIAQSLFKFASQLLFKNIWLELNKFRGFVRQVMADSKWPRASGQDGQHQTTSSSEILFV